MTSGLGRDRLRRLIYLGLAAAIFMILAMGISSVQPQPGEIVFAPRTEREIPVTDSSGETIISYEDDRGHPFWYLLGFIGFVLTIYGIYRSRRFRYGFFFLLLFALFLRGIIFAYTLIYTESSEETVAAGNFFEPYQERPPEELFNNPPDWLDSVSLVTTIAVIFITGGMIWGASKIRTQRKPPLELVAKEAEAALADIRAGAAVNNVVLRCYLDMSRALARQRGLARQEGMTPREFEDVLIAQALPPTSVKRLTRLFERVRYGGQEATERDKQEAVSALEEIVAAIRRPDETLRNEDAGVNMAM